MTNAVDKEPGSHLYRAEIIYRGVWKPLQKQSIRIRRGAPPATNAACLPASTCPSTLTRHPGCKKLKCTGEQPACSRCDKKGLTCVYAVQKPIGRPRKRRAVDDEPPTSNEGDTTVAPKPSGSLGAWTSPPGVITSAWDSDDDGQWFDGRGFGTPLLPVITQTPWPALFSADEHHDVPSSAAVPGLASGSSDGSTPSADTVETTPNSIEETRIQATAATDAHSVPCACLSSIYLCLSTLQTMSDFRFPAPLHTIRQCIRTAWDVLHCQECPKIYFTAFQNVQLLGMLMVGCAERYTRILAAVEAEERNAVAESRLLTLCVGDLQGSDTHLHHADPESCMGSVNIDLLPAQWRTLVKGVIRGEVKGGPKGCCPSFQSLLDGMVSRQGWWHSIALPFQCPRPWTVDEIEAVQAGKHEGDCLRMVNETRKIIDHMNFD